MSFRSPPAAEIRGLVLPSQALCQSQLEINVAEQAEQKKKKKLLKIQKTIKKQKE